MHFSIDHSSERSVYLQIVDQVKRDVALGRLKTGDKLSTVRQLASDLAINPNTIAKAYRQLEGEQIITTKPGSGAFVADLDNQLSRAVKRKIITGQLERTAVQAFHMQLERDTVTEWFARAMDKFNLLQRKG